MKEKNECKCNLCDMIKQTTWIRVEDRLPEDDRDVLVYHSDDRHITVGYFEKDNVQYYIESDGRKFYTDSGWETEIPWAQKGGVTHWMPLPEPPNEYCIKCKNENVACVCMSEDENHCET